MPGVTKSSLLLHKVHARTCMYFMRLGGNANRPLVDCPGGFVHVADLPVS